MGWVGGLGLSVDPGPLPSAGLGLVAAPPTFPTAPGCFQPQVMVWITWFLLTLMGSSPASHPGRCGFPCMDSTQLIPDPGVDFVHGCLFSPCLL